MGELIPVVFGVLVAGTTALVPVRARLVAFPVMCVLAGLLASAINGELANAGWLFFVSFDTLLVWGAATAVTSIHWWLRRRHATP